MESINRMLLSILVLLQVMMSNITFPATGIIGAYAFPTHLSPVTLDFSAQDLDYRIEMSNRLTGITRYFIKSNIKATIAYLMINGHKVRLDDAKRRVESVLCTSPFNNRCTVQYTDNTSKEYVVSSEGIKEVNGNDDADSSSSSYRSSAGYKRDESSASGIAQPKTDGNAGSADGSSPGARSNLRSDDKSSSGLDRKRQDQERDLPDYLKGNSSQTSYSATTTDTKTRDTSSSPYYGLHQRVGANGRSTTGDHANNTSKSQGEADGKSNTTHGPGKSLTDTDSDASKPDANKPSSNKSHAPMKNSKSDISKTDSKSQSKPENKPTNVRGGSTNTNKKPAKGAGTKTVVDSDVSKSYNPFEEEEEEDEGKADASAAPPIVQELLNTPGAAKTDSKSQSKPENKPTNVRGGSTNTNKKPAKGDGTKTVVDSDVSKSYNPFEEEGEEDEGKADASSARPTVQELLNKPGAAKTDSKSQSKPENKPTNVRGGSTNTNKKPAKGDGTKTAVDSDVSKSYNPFEAEDKGAGTADASSARPTVQELLNTPGAAPGTKPTISEVPFAMDKDKDTKTTESSNSSGSTSTTKEVTLVYGGENPDILEDYAGEVPCYKAKSGHIITNLVIDGKSRVVGGYKPIQTIVCIVKEGSKYSVVVGSLDNNNWTTTYLSKTGDREILRDVSIKDKFAGVDYHMLMLKMFTELALPRHVSAISNFSFNGRSNASMKQLKPGAPVYILENVENGYERRKREIKFIDGPLRTPEGMVLKHMETDTTGQKEYLIITFMGGTLLHHKKYTVTSSAGSYKAISYAPSSDYKMQRTMLCYNLRSYAIFNIIDVENLESGAILADLTIQKFGNVSFLTVDKQLVDTLMLIGEYEVLLKSSEKHSISITTNNGRFNVQVTSTGDKEVNRVSIIPEVNEKEGYVVYFS